MLTLYLSLFFGIYTLWVPYHTVSLQGQKLQLIDPQHVTMLECAHHLVRMQPGLRQAGVFWESGNQYKIAELLCFWIRCFDQIQQQWAPLELKLWSLPFPTEKNQSSLKKWLIWGLGQEGHEISYQTRKERSDWKRLEACQKDTGANLLQGLPLAKIRQSYQQKLIISTMYQKCQKSVCS